MRYVGASRPRVSRTCAGLEDEGLLTRRGVEDAKPMWTTRLTLDAAAIEPSPTRRRAFQAAMAARIASRRGAQNDVAVVEAHRHFRQAGSRREAVETGVRAVRCLRGTFQNRAALEVLRGLLDLVPESRCKRHHELVLEAADLCASLGEIDAGLELLRGQVTPQKSRRLSGAARLRALLRIATLHSRRGDYQRADRLFSDAFSQLRKGASRNGATIALGERLRFLNEHAALKGLLGCLDESLAYCDEGLAEGSKHRGLRVREAILNLWATRANVSLRRLDPAGAAEDYQKALHIAESIGSDVNHAVVLNNLGIVYMQTERSKDAIRVFAEAEQLCARLDEGPSLVSVYANVAVLHARHGHVEECEEALERGAALGPSTMGRRLEFLLEHARAICRLYSGRYAEALQLFDRALELGRPMQDRHMPGFEEVYRAEAAIHVGRYAEAEQALESVIRDPRSHDRLRGVALARRAYLMAACGRYQEAIACVERYAEPAGDGPWTFLCALDAVYLGWTSSMAGHGSRAEDLLDRAARFFALREYQTLASWVEWIRAESAFLDGGQGLVSNVANGAIAERNGLLAALWPLLEARVALTAPTETGLRRAADLLARAATKLTESGLAEWDLRCRALRARLNPSGRGDAARASVESDRRRLARELPAETRDAYVASRHWLEWTDVTLPDSLATASSTGGSDPHSVGDASEVTARLERFDDSLRGRLVARSRGMRQLLEILDRLRNVELPVHIGGETGTGKELVARIIHAESRRRDAPFQVIDCLALSPGVLEAELFGARAGAFTDAIEDRPGLLVAADRGTVFLDDVDSLPLEAQARLLRVISMGRIRALGAETETSVDLRFICSTRGNLGSKVRLGSFREDLFHRIHVLSIELPPLRERLEDLPELARRFVAESDASPGEDHDIDSSALEALAARRWPGNVRELKNFLTRLALSCPGRFTARDVHGLDGDPTTRILFPKHLLHSEPLENLRNRLERDYLLYHFRRFNGDARALADWLGVTRRHLYRRCERLNLSLREAKQELSRGGKGD